MPRATVPRVPVTLHLFFLVLLTAPMVPALPGESVSLGAGLAAEVTVSDVVADQSTVQFAVSARNGTADVQAVVTHDDPVLGPVVDRVVRLNLSANTTAEVRLDDLQAGVNRTLRLLNASTLLPTLSPTSVLPDPLGVTKLPSLLTVQVPLPPYAGPAHANVTLRFRGYPLAETEFESPGSVHILDNGLLTAGITQVFRNATGATTGGLQVAVSHDGGKTFGTPVVVARDAGGLGGWVSAAPPTGVVTYLYQEMPPANSGSPPAIILPSNGSMPSDWSSSTSPNSPAPLRYARFDPALGQVVAGGVLRDGLRYAGSRSAAALADGSVLVAARDPLDNATGQPRVALDLWRLAPDGSAELLQSWPAPERYDRSQPVHVAASPTGEVVVFWTEAHPVQRPEQAGADDGFRQMFYARSPDGGRTFLPAVEVRGFLDQPARLAWIRTTGLGVDTLGTLHVAAVAGHGVTWTNTSEATYSNEDTTAYYGRFPALGPGTVLPLNGATRGALLPSVTEARDPGLAVRGTRVWLFFQGEHRLTYNTGAADGTFAFESTDGGLTMQPPYKAATETGSGLSNMDGLDTFPDGRPVMMTWYFRPNAGYAMATVPLFDPLPQPDDPKTQVRHHALALPPGSVDASPIPIVPDDGSKPPPAADTQGVGNVELPAGSAEIGIGVGATVVAAAVAVTEAGKFGLGGLLATLYTRLPRSDILKNDVRAGVFQHVQAHPGIRYEDLRRDLGLANGTLAFHLRLLQREGYVAARSEWTRRRFYSTGSAPPAAEAQDAGAVVCGLLARSPGLTAADIATRLKMSRQLARYHLTRLERRGDVERVSGGRSAGYRVRGIPGREGRDANGLPPARRVG